MKTKVLYVTLLGNGRVYSMARPVRKGGMLLVCSRGDYVSYDRRAFRNSFQSDGMRRIIDELFSLPGIVAIGAQKSSITVFAEQKAMWDVLDKEVRRVLNFREQYEVTVESGGRGRRKRQGNQMGVLELLSSGVFPPGPSQISETE
jgi:hypothetical protein